MTMPDSSFAVSPALNTSCLPASLFTLLLITLLFTAMPALAALDWPQEITAEEGTIVVYQPQPETLEGNVLSGRAAVSLAVKDKDDLVFGAMWFSARLDVSGDMATVRDFKVTKVTWPDSNDAAEQRFTAIVEGAVPDAGFEISMERLSSSLATAELQQRSLDNLKTDPPEIIFRDTLSVLLLYDGAPKYADIENSPYERVLNTTFAVIREKKSAATYLSSGAFWYQSRDPMGPFAVTQTPPADLVKMLAQANQNSDDDTPASPPAVVVATVPTELIATDGEPDWISLAGGELLYVKNTESPWLRELSTGNMYILISGRWYRSKHQSGPWTFVRPDELPQSFAQIPPASDIGGLRSSVAGTEEADNAVREAAIPQTAAIKRSEATLNVEYDGKPDFEKIKGTDVSYAVNTAAQVLLINNQYYAVDNAVWFSSASATGPWVVADNIPDEDIQKIPPSSPVYNTTYVHVYESTPEVVYVGYLPGYMWSFPYYGVPVYGSGWYYPPYYGRYYYPRPPTWGFNVGYNPWTGWSFGLSWSNGFFSMGVRWGGGYGGGYYPGHCCGGYYGGGYRGPVFINTGDINIGNSVNIGNRTNIGNKIGNNNQRFDGQRNNIYNRPANLDRKAAAGTAKRDLKMARSAPERANNVFADKSGAVARNNNGKWETRENGSWKPDTSKISSDTRDQAAQAAKDRGVSRDSAASAAQQAKSQLPQTRPASKPATRPASSASQRPSTWPSTMPSIDHRDLNRANYARQTGAARERARPMPQRRGGGRFR